LGRFEHEAAAVDPRTGEIYLTEDAAGPSGLLYRWQPPSGFRPGRGALRGLRPTDGVLAAMKATDAAGKHVADLSRASVGTTYGVEWVPVPDRDGRNTPTRRQLGNGDVTRSRKLEGAWWAGAGAYVVASYSRESDNKGVAKAHDGRVHGSGLRPGAQHPVRQHPGAGLHVRHHRPRARSTLLTVRPA
jgi:uncharacterized protein